MMGEIGQFALHLKKAKYFISILLRMMNSERGYGYVQGIVIMKVTSFIQMMILRIFTCWEVEIKIGEYVLYS
jgi:hypothetical protein